MVGSLLHRFRLAGLRANRKAVGFAHGLRGFRSSGSGSGRSRLAGCLPMLRGREGRVVPLAPGAEGTGRARQVAGVTLDAGGAHCGLRAHVTPGPDLGPRDDTAPVAHQRRYLLTTVPGMGTPTISPAACPTAAGAPSQTRQAR